MQKSNYQIMQEQMAERFLRYDQEKMIEKFQLACNAEYIYITFVNSPYQINRKNRRNTGAEEGRGKLGPDQL